jgi:Divergent InlB B-repeat domain
VVSRRGGTLNFAFARATVSLLIAALVASDVSAAQLTASWIDNSSGQAAFELDRRAQNEFAFSKIADVPAGSQSYVDSDVVEGVTYCYRIRAYTDFGASPYSDEACGSVVASTVAPSTDVPSSFTLTINNIGPGSGVVSSASGPLACWWSCSATFAAGTIVTLKAMPAAGSRFVGWSGGCSGTSSCTVTGNTAVAVTATFSRM